MEYHDHAAPFREVGAAPAACLYPNNPCACATDTEHGASSKELAARFPKFFKPAEPEMTAQAAANNLLRRLSREIFEDGITVEKLPEAVGIVEDALSSYAGQAESDAKFWQSECDTNRELGKDAEAKVATLKALAEENDEDFSVLCDKLAAAESELREMREVLDHTLLCMNRSCKYCRDLLARKAGS